MNPSESLIGWPMMPRRALPWEIKRVRSLFLSDVFFSTTRLYATHYQSFTLSCKDCKILFLDPLSLPFIFPNSFHFFTLYFLQCLYLFIKLHSFHKKILILTLYADDKCLTHQTSKTNMQKFYSHILLGLPTV